MACVSEADVGPNILSWADSDIVKAKAADDGNLVSPGDTVIDNVTY